MFPPCGASGAVALLSGVCLTPGAFSEAQQEPRGAQGLD